MSDFPINQTIDDSISNIREFCDESLKSDNSVCAVNSSAQRNFIFKHIEGKYETDGILNFKQFKLFLMKIWSEKFWELSESWLDIHLNFSWCSQDMRKPKPIRLLGGRQEFKLRFLNRVYLIFYLINFKKIYKIKH